MAMRKRDLPSTLLMIAVLVPLLFAGTGEGQTQTAATLAWAPKPSQLVPYAAPNRPLWKLSDIRARHAGEANWSEPVADTPDFSCALRLRWRPARARKDLMYADDRAFWVVESGQIRFQIEGQAPFIATKGFLVQVLPPATLVQARNGGQRAIVAL